MANYTLPSEDLKRTQAAWPRVRSRLRRLEIAGDFALRVWWHHALLAGVIQVYLYAILELITAIRSDLRTYHHWPYPKKMVALYTVTFFFTLPFLPSPPHAPAFMLVLVFLGGIGTVHLFARRLQRWAQNP